MHLINAVFILSTNIIKQKYNKIIYLLKFYTFRFLLLFIYLCICVCFHCINAFINYKSKQTSKYLLKDPMGLTISAILLALFDGNQEKIINKSVQFYNFEMQLNHGPNHCISVAYCGCDKLAIYFYDGTKFITYAVYCKDSSFFVCFWVFVVVCLICFYVCFFFFLGGGGGQFLFFFFFFGGGELVLVLICFFNM